MTVSAAPHWYALRTRSRHEGTVRRGLSEVAIEAFLPTITRWSRWKDRKKRIDWPLFPGYCFAPFGAEGRLAALQRRGVVDVVSMDGVPAVIPDTEIEAVRRLVETDLQYDPCPLLKQGMSVEVIAGPLAGVVGRLERKGPHARLVLSVSLLNSGVSVEVDAADVRPY